MNIRSLRFRVAVWCFCTVSGIFMLAATGYWFAIRSGLNTARDEGLRYRLIGLRQYLQDADTEKTVASRMGDLYYFGELYEVFENLLGAPPPPPPPDVPALKEAGEGGQHDDRHRGNPGNEDRVHHRLAEHHVLVGEDAGDVGAELVAGGERRRHRGDVAVRPGGHDDHVVERSGGQQDGDRQAEVDELAGTVIEGRVGEAEGGARRLPSHVQLLSPIGLLAHRVLK